MIISVKDGKTPYIGANGNWWIGDTDTGVKAEYTETDPTVPAWAKEPTKPTYTAGEVGAVADGGGYVNGNYTLDGNLTIADGEMRTPTLVLGDGDIGVSLSGYYSGGSPYIEMLGSISDERVVLRPLADPQDNYDAANKQYVDTSINNAAPLMVTFSDEDDFSADCTFAEIYDAISADRQVIGRLNDSGEIITYSVAWYGGDYVAFLRLAYPNIVDVIWIYDDDSYEREEVSLSPYQHTHTPASIGAVSRSGDQISGNYSLQGNLSLNGEVYINDSVESDLIVNGSVEVAASSTFHDDVTVEGVLFTANDDHVYLHSGNVLDYAAPAGYGLGEVVRSAFSTIEQVDAFKVSGVRVVSLTDGHNIGGSTMGKLVCVATPRIYTQIFSFYYAGYGGLISLERVCTNDLDWQEWEYVNPPMTTSGEYRTTERIGGKAVYKKNVNGVIQYRLDGETTWKNYNEAVGAAPAIACSTTDLTAGSSSLTTGTLYVVYE